jgi:hypothetical protein
MKNKELQLKQQAESSTQSISSLTTMINLNFDDEFGNESEDRITNNFDNTIFFFMWEFNNREWN